MAAQIVARDEGSARVLAISNPARKGAVDAAALAQLEEEAERATDDGVRALILTGQGADFCSGYDLSSIESAGEAWDPTDSPLPDLPLSRACDALEKAAPPVICAIEGAAMGAGLELACACDFRIASRTTRFALPPAKLGLVYAPEGIQRVLRLVGLQAARRLFLRAERFDPDEALRLGLVDELVASPLQRAAQLADEIARLAPMSIRGMKRALLALARGPLDESERQELDGLRRMAFGSDDAREGRAAFLEKRDPRWTGK